MGDFMAYLYQQAPYPANVTGVPISIDANDPNGNPIHIADVTSDASGTFAYTWTPTNPGEYKITATFAGDYSYGASWAETHANVVNAPTSTITPTSSTSNLATSNDIMLDFVVVAIAIILAIAIATVLILRKH
jgi:hypothetical protein